MASEASSGFGRRSTLLVLFAAECGVCAGIWYATTVQYATFHVSIGKATITMDSTYKCVDRDCLIRPMDNADKLLVPLQDHRHLWRPYRGPDKRDQEPVVRRTQGGFRSTSSRDCATYSDADYRVVQTQELCGTWQDARRGLRPVHQLHLLSLLALRIHRLRRRSRDLVLRLCRQEDLSRILRCKRRRQGYDVLRHRSIRRRSLETDRLAHEAQQA